MKKGGYQIIDLSAYKFTNGESQTITNVYNIIKNTKKVVLISGLTVDETEYHDMFTVFIPYETYFYGLAQYEGNNIYFVVNNDGSVVVNIASAKTPIAYLYNGVQLPPLPEWDKTTFPYAFIYNKDGASDRLNPTYYLIVSKNPFTIKYNRTLILTTYKVYDSVDNNKGDYIKWWKTAKYTEFVPDDGSLYNTFSININNESYTGCFPIWTNTDIYYGENYETHEGDTSKAGTLYLVGSYPVPVYE